MENKIFKVEVRNQARPRLSGHLILAESEQDAIRIQAKYKIGNPMGGQAELKRIFPATQREISNAKNGANSIWFEEEGELKHA